MINLNKGSFMKEEILYLGFVILDDGLKMDPKKVKATLNWATLENVRDIRSFHGLKSFYKKFFKNFSSICDAMIEPMRGDKKDFKWTHGAQKSFETLEQKIA